MILVSYFRDGIDTDTRSPDRGELVKVGVEAAPFGSAEACRRALLDAYRPSLSHVAVTVAEVPVLGPKLTAPASTTPVGRPAREPGGPARRHRLRVSGDSRRGDPS